MSDTSIEWAQNADGSRGKTWNCIRGCTDDNPECLNCFAKSIAARFSGPGLVFEGFAKRAAHKRPQWTGKTELIREKLDEPLSWGKPQTVFANSMSDMFHPGFSDEDIAEQFGVMAVAGAFGPFRSPRKPGRFGGLKQSFAKKGPHTFIVFTKRAERAQKLLSSRAFQILVAKAAYRWAKDRICMGYVYQAICGLSENGEAPVAPTHWPLPNVWLGVSAGTQKTVDEKLPFLMETPAAVRIASIEPLLERVDLSAFLRPSGEDWCDIHGHEWSEMDSAGNPTDPNATCLQCSLELDRNYLDWAILGGESGRGARRCDIGWLRDAVCQIEGSDCALFVKQLGAVSTFECKTYTPNDNEVCVQCGYAEGFHQPIVPRRMVSKKGTDPREWPEDLRVREWPKGRATA